MRDHRVILQSPRALIVRVFQRPSRNASQVKLQANTSLSPRTGVTRTYGSAIMRLSRLPFGSSGLSGRNITWWNRFHDERMYSSGTWSARAGPRCGAAARPGARRNPPSARLPRAVWRAAPAHSHTPGSHAARRRPHPSRRRARSRNAATCRRGRTPSSAPMSTCRSPAVRAELTLSDSGRAPAADS